MSHSFSLLDQFPEAVLVADAAGRITYANARAEALFGCGPGELSGLPTADCLPNEQTARRQDGAGLAVEVSRGPLTQESGPPLTVYLVREVTPRLRTDHEQRLQAAALAASANGVVIADTDGRILWVNPAFSRLTGYTAEEALGRRTNLLRSGVHDQAFYQQLWDTIQAGQVWQGEIINRRQDGQLYVEEQTITPVCDADGRITHFIAIKQDVSTRKQAEAALRRQIEYREALNMVTLGLLGRRDLGELLEEIVGRAAQLVEAAGGYLDLVDTAGQLRPAVATGILSESLQHAVQPGQGMAGIVWQTGQPLVVNDYAAWAGRGEEDARGALRAVVGVPLLLAGRVEGVLGLAYGRETEKQFGEAEVELLTRFAQLAVLTLHDTRLFQAALRASERRAVLLDASHRIAASLVPEQICAAAEHAAAQLVPCQGFALAVPAEIGPGIELICPGNQAEVTEAAQQVCQTGRMLHPGSGRGVLALPLRLPGGQAGAMCVRGEPDWTPSTEDEELLQLLAAQVAQALGNARLFADVQRLAITDTLTGVPNRRRFFELAEREYERARRYPQPLSAIMLDIDHFKSVNDRFGHAVGDRVLRAVAEHCRRQLRDPDILGRYGGEEFAVLLPATDLTRAGRVAERLCSQMTGEAVETPDGPARVTLSLGVAALDAACPSLEALLERADQALYAAKRGGRNQVRLWPPAA